MIVKSNPRRTLAVLLVLLTGVLTAQAQPFTPTPPRPPALVDADRAFWNGDYESALAGYNQAAASPDAACEAAFSIGRVYLQQQRYADADATFTQQMNACGASFRALALRGDARQQNGDDAGALADYEAALAAQPGVIDSYLFERIAAVNPDASVLYLRLAAEAGREPQGEFALRNELAQIYLLIARQDEAFVQYDAILSRGLLSPDDQRRDIAAIEVEAAELEIAVGNADAGYARLQRVISEYTTTAAAFDALILLVNASQPVDLLTRMRINVANENYTPVVGVLADLLAAPDESVVPELYLLLGISQRALGDPAAALATFQQARDRYPGDPAASQVALEQAETYVEAGDTANGIIVYQQVAAAYPQSPEAPQALLTAARLLREQGDTAGAIAQYEQLGAAYPGIEEAEQGLFEAARLLQAAGDTQRAAELYGRSGSSHGLLWQGKLLQAVGDSGGASAAWEAAVNADPGTFFSQRACALLNNIPPYEPSSNIRLSEPTADDISAAEAWVGQTFGVQASAALSPELASNPLLVRGTELWALGWRREANAEFIALHRQFRLDAPAMFQLASYYRGIGAYRMSIIAAVRVYVLSGQPLPAVPSYIARMAFPIYYADLVLPAAQEYGLDPLYVASLIRQESTYDATAVSSADARGLMQLIPSTAADVAGRLGLADYELRDLFRPTVNVAMGSFYLASTRDFLDGDVVGALLGYNAGPGRAAQWTASAGGDIDLLYEIIPFEETQLYLDITYENFGVYRYLYGDGMPDCMFTVAPPVTPTAVAS